LRRFRQQAYQLFTHGKDAFFELLDAVLQTPRAGSFVELSLAPACTRQWPSVYQALANARYDAQELNDLCLAQVPTEQVAHFAIDVTGLRRLRSPTLRERRYYHGAAREAHGRGVLIGLPYSIVAWTPQRGSSFAPAVQSQRLAPEQKAVAVAVAQVLRLGLDTPSQLDWRAALDGAYGNKEFFAPLQGKAVQVVARTRDDSVFYRRARPEDYGGRGRRPTFGAVFRCADASTWGPPDESVCFDDAQHGRVELQLWRGLGWRKKGQFIAVEVLRSQIHAARDKPPEPHWYTAHNGKPEQTVRARDWYETIAHRWCIEPANRFRKERLYADLPKVRKATGSDHWLLGVQLLEWELYLARDQVAQKVLPWQKPLPLTEMTPNRVIQSLPDHLSQVGTPVGEVRPRGKSPGWPVGKARSVPTKYKLTPKRRKKAIQVSKNA
jgi:hypothetical protein